MGIRKKGQELTNTRWQLEQVFVPGFGHGTDGAGSDCFLLAQDNGFILMDGRRIEMGLMTMREESEKGTGRRGRKVCVYRSISISAAG